RPDPELPEIAFAGRSNVGKSSLLNRLVRRKAFARVSRTPGRTREINFFRVNDQFMLVDLPGYGYAKISKERKAGWRPLLEGYLGGTTRLSGVVQLLDIRREPSEDDVSMLDFLANLEIPAIVVLTKIDKLSRGAVAGRADEIVRGLMLDRAQIIAFSAVTGEGRDELATAVSTLVAAADATDAANTAHAANTSDAAATSHTGAGVATGGAAPIGDREPGGGSS
ncbi:MAG: ribosome biogenesis GTP-binding protein YihA/YsxC, partial [Gemmatimonadaceae bacterium]